MASHIPIGQRLLHGRRIDTEQLGRALAHQRKWGGRLGDALVALKLVSEPDLLTELARQHGVRYVQIGERSVPAEIVRLVPQKYVRSRRVFPIALAPDQRRGKLFVATSAPQNLPVLDEVAFITGMTVQPVLVSDRDLDETIQRHFGGAVAGVLPSPSTGAHPSTGAAIKAACPAAANHVERHPPIPGPEGVLRYPELASSLLRREGVASRRLGGARPGGAC